MSQYQHSYAGRWQQQPVTAQPKRKWWTLRRKFFAALSVAALALIALVAVPRAMAAFTPRDYHDPVQLAQAVKNAEQAKTGNVAGYASCGKYLAGKYFCAVAFPGGTEGNYVVTVAPDGRSWSAA